MVIVVIISKEEFINALDLIAPEDKMMVSMYFGLNGSEMSIPQIAIATKTNPIAVKTNLERTLRQINSLAKSKDLGKNVMNQKYQNIKLRIARASGLLLQDASFLALMSTNPMIANLLSLVTNTNLSLEDASKAMGIPSDVLMSELMSLEVMCEEFTKNAPTKNSSGFQDEETIKNKEVGRRY